MPSRLLMLVHKRELCWGVLADMDEEADIAPAVVGTAGSSSPAAVSSPVAAVDTLASVPQDLYADPYYDTIRENRPSSNSVAL